MADDPESFFENDENLDNLLASYDASSEDVVTEAPMVSAQVVEGVNMVVFGTPTFSASGTHDRSPELIQG